jgi:hypothetical protein
MFVSGIFNPLQVGRASPCDRDNDDFRRVIWVVVQNMRCQIGCQGRSCLDHEQQL